MWAAVGKFTTGTQNLQIEGGRWISMLKRRVIILSIVQAMTIECMGNTRTGLTPLPGLRACLVAKVAWPKVLCNLLWGGRAAWVVCSWLLWLEFWGFLLWSAGSLDCQWSFHLWTLFYLSTASLLVSISVVSALQYFLFAGTDSFCFCVHVMVLKLFDGRLGAVWLITLMFTAKKPGSQLLLRWRGHRLPCILNIYSHTLCMFWLIIQGSQ